MDTNELARHTSGGPARHKSGGPARHPGGGRQGGVEDEVVLEIESVE